MDSNDLSPDIRRLIHEALVKQVRDQLGTDDPLVLEKLGAAESAQFFREGKFEAALDSAEMALFDFDSRGKISRRTSLPARSVADSSEPEGFWVSPEGEGTRKIGRVAVGHVVQLHFQLADLFVELVLVGVGLLAPLFAAVAEDIGQAGQGLLLPAPDLGRVTMW